MVEPVGGRKLGLFVVGYLASVLFVSSAPARAVAGVLDFDIARDLLDSNTFIATEVFEDAAARERQESLEEVGRVMSLLPDSVTAPPEATVYEVYSADPAM